MAAAPGFVELCASQTPGSPRTWAQEKRDRAFHLRRIAGDLRRRLVQRDRARIEESDLTRLTRLHFGASPSQSPPPAASPGCRRISSPHRHRCVPYARGEPARGGPRRRRAAAEPFFVVAASGTTNTGAVDPLNEIADIVAQENLWLHVDAAYGGGFGAVRGSERKTDGIERAQFFDR
ncbi:MAG: pyridoxal-dependent decarboxylase [Parvularculaceae bacterium]